MLRSKLHPLEPAPLLSNRSNTTLYKSVGGCVVNCLRVLEVFPPLVMIKDLNMLQLALVSSLIVECNNILECSTSWTACAIHPHKYFTHYGNCNQVIEPLADSHCLRCRSAIYLQSALRQRRHL